MRTYTLLGQADNLYLVGDENGNAEIVKLVPAEHAGWNSVVVQIPPLMGDLDKYDVIQTETIKLDIYEFVGRSIFIGYGKESKRWFRRYHE